MLSCKLIVSYCSMQFCLNMIYANFPTMRLFVYKDALRMPLGTMSWLLTLAKTIDIITGFVIGKLSDETRTRWGRRKPYIAVAWPLGAVVMVLFLSGSSIFGGKAPSAPCHDLATLPTGNATCAALRACLDEGIANGTLLAPTAVDMPTYESISGSSVAVFFYIMYSLYFTTVISGAQLNYDALGQELTDNHDERLRLFSWKQLFSMIGASVGTLMLGNFSDMYPTDLSTASVMTMLTTAVLMLLALSLLLCNVTERPLQPRKEVGLPVAAQIHRMVSNPKYVIYLLMRIPMTVLGLLPYQLIVYYLQNNLQLEDVPTPRTNIGYTAIFGSIVSIPLMNICARRFGRPITLTVTLGVIGSLFLVAFFLTSVLTVNMLYFLTTFMGACLTIPYLIPDAMLGDIIDYDELLYGERNEAMFSMVETNVQQFTEILLAMSTMFMAVSGFENLGGCECGCGVDCERAMGYKFARWVCPGSVGYACDESANTITASFDAALLYQPEPAQAPCTVQNDSVKWVTAFFIFGLPGICGLLAIVPIRIAVISKEQHTQILEGIEKLKQDANASVEDPLVGGLVVRPSNTEESIFSEQFTMWERKLAQAGGGMKQLTAYLGTKIGVYAVILIGLIIANVLAQKDALLQISFWVLAVLFVLVPFDSLRLLASRNPPGGRLLPPGKGSEYGAELTQSKPEDRVVSERI